MVIDEKETFLIVYPGGEESDEKSAHLGPPFPPGHPPVICPFVKHWADGVQQWSLQPNRENMRPHKPCSHPPLVQAPHDEPQLLQDDLHLHVSQVGWTTRTGAGQQVGGASLGQ